MRLGTILAALLVLVLGTTQAGAQGKRVALVIGNSAYKHTTVLKNPGNDAADMAAVFQSLGFEVIPGIDLEHRGLLRAIRQFGEAVKGADAAVLFYSGHGIQVRGTNYLVPVDAELQHEIEVDAQTVKLDLVLEQMERQAKTTIVFLDACRDNPLARTLARSMDATRAVDVGKGLAPVRAASFGTFVSFATAPNNVALDGSGRNSPFTEALKKYILEPGKDLGAVMINVRNDVIAATKEKQVPWENSALRAQFFFKPDAPKSAPVAPPAAAPQAPMSEAAQAWAAAKDATNIAVLEAFFRRFGDSFYGDLALARIEELWKSQVAVVAPPPKPPEPAPKSVAPPPTPTSTARPAACDGVDVALGSGGTACIKPGSGRTFRDCPDCPEMVVVPAGSFMMGSNDGDTDEKPIHRVTLAKPFAVGKFEVTFAEWDACFADGGCKHKPETEWGRGRQPVMRVSWEDAKEYVTWLSRKVGKTYRLLSEAEWEYAARAGTTTKYSWGDTPGRNNANCDGCGSQWDNKQTAAVGSFKPNAFGLHDMHGNLWEWVEDCWHHDYSGAPSDGRAWTTACIDGNPRVLRGGAWDDGPQYLRSAFRNRFPPVSRFNYYGFRVGRTLTP